MIYFHFNRHCLFILLAFVGSYYRVCRRILAERRSGGPFSSFEVRGKAVAGVVGASCSNIWSLGGMGATGVLLGRRSVNAWFSKGIGLSGVSSLAGCRCSICAVRRSPVSTFCIWAVWPLSPIRVIMYGPRNGAISADPVSLLAIVRLR